MSAHVNSCTLAVISIAPNMRGYLGHCFNYQQSVDNAATINGWTYRVAIPEDCQIESTQAGWKKCLLGRAPRTLLGKMGSFFPYTKRIYAYLAEQARAYDGIEKVIFLESFYVLQLVAILAATIFLSRRDTAVWLLYRYGVAELRTSRLLNRLVVTAFSWLFRGRVLLLTDSELLKMPLEEFFGRECSVLPIPHAGLPGERTTGHNNRGPLVVWWPGEPRPSKGLDIVRGIIALPVAGDEKIRVVLSEDVPLDVARMRCGVVRVDASLSPKKYEELLSTSDIVLLPYDRDVYAAGTSGVFVESIIAGALPLVTVGTWMEYELKRYNLSELATSWNDISGFVAWAEDMYANREVRAKLKRMQESYLQFHNEKSFAETMLALSMQRVDDSV